MTTMRPARFHYRLGANQPAASPTARRLAEMAEAILRETDGGLRLEVFPESRLGPDPQMFADLRGGGLEFYLSGALLGGVAPTSAQSLRLHEVQRYLSLTAHWWSGFTLLANAAAWQKLPAEIQTVVARNAATFALLQRDDIERVNAAGAEALARNGMIVNAADTASI